MALHVMEEMEMAEPIVRILPLLSCVCKKGYESRLRDRNEGELGKRQCQITIGGGKK